MKKMWGKIFTTAALACMLCLSGLVMSGEVQAQRFVDNGNGTVTDTVTGLMWTKNANPFGRLNYNAARERCSTHTIEGIGGWRLPTRLELVALAHAIRIHGVHPFTGFQSSDYWSDGGRWLVHMPTGELDFDDETKAYRVWPVRGPQ